MSRCGWADLDPLLADYHDHEWGVPNHDDRLLFEFLCLEGAQAGLSWLTILKKREAYRKAFARFDPAKVARFTDERLEQLLTDPGIVRNRQKVFAFRQNARAFLALQKEFGAFDAWLWAQPPDPTALSKELKRRGFTFVGPTIVESFLEAVGVLDHHVPGCVGGVGGLGGGADKAGPSPRSARRKPAAERRAPQCERP